MPCEPGPPSRDGRESPRRERKLVCGGRQRRRKGGRRQRDRDRERHTEGGGDTERYVRIDGDAGSEGGKNVSILDFMQERKQRLPCSFLVTETMTHHVPNDDGAALKTRLCTSVGWALLSSCGEHPAASRPVESVPQLSARGQGSQDPIPLPT